MPHLNLGHVRADSTPSRWKPISYLTLALAGLLTGASAWAEADTLGNKQIDTRPVLEQMQPSTLPAGWQKGAFMEVFVRAYKDSDGDGMGDLKGLTQQLDYLKDLKEGN